ncbi:MAG: TRAP transporter substrate-binding protein DctP [Firmicutes bacterium]|nr:TRAP transporter substrate-binding protein DctP [Bacillota bacterium]
MVVLITVLVLALGGQGLSAPKYVLKFNHVLAQTEPFHQGFLNWAKRVYERTNGGLEIQVFHSAQLGVEEDILEQIRQGANIGQNTDSARLGMYVPDIAVRHAPYFVDSIEEVMKLRELPTVKKWLKEVEDKYGFKVLSFAWVQGMRHMVTNKPIRKPEDLKGLRIRTPGAPIWQESIRSHGAAPVALNFGEVYLAMQQKAIDGADLVYRNVTGAKLYEVAKYISETRHILLINFEVISKKFFDSLPPNYQKILVEECDKAGYETSKLMEKEIEDIKKFLIEKGMTIIETKDIDIAALKKAGEAAYKVLNLTKARDEIYKELGKKY